MSDLTQQVAAALKDDTLTAERCQALLAQLQAHHAELQARYAQIARGDRAHQPIGGERVRVMESGEVAALSKLNAETKDVEAELQMLSHQREALTKRRAGVLGRDAADGMPDLYKSLESALRSAGKKRDAYVNALTDVQDSLQRLEDARTAAARAGLRGLPEGGPKFYELLEAVVPPEPPQRLFGRHAPDVLERALGARRERAA